MIRDILSGDPSAIVAAAGGLVGIFLILQGLLWIVRRVNDEILTARRVAQMVGREAAPAISVFRDDRPTATERIAAVAMPSTFGQFRARFRRAGLPIDLRLYVCAIVLFGAGLSWVVHVSALPPFVPAIFFAFGLHVALDRVLVAMLIEKRRGKCLKQLPLAVEYLQRAMQVGQPMESALAGVPGAVEEPMSSMFAQIPRSMRLGMSAVEAMQAIAKDIDLPEFEFLVAACEAQAAAGGNMVPILETLANMLRQREHLRLKIQSLSAEGKMSAWVLSMLPPLLLLYFSVAQPEYVRPLWVTNAGHAMLGVASFLVGMGAVVMAKIIKIKV